MSHVFSYRFGLCLLPKSLPTYLQHIPKHPPKHINNLTVVRIWRGFLNILVPKMLVSLKDPKGFTKVREAGGKKNIFLYFWLFSFAFLYCVVFFFIFVCLSLCFFIFLCLSLFFIVFIIFPYASLFFLMYYCFSLFLCVFHFFHFSLFFLAFPKMLELTGLFATSGYSGKASERFFGGF